MLLASVNMKSPLKDKPLRNPGESLRDDIQEFIYDKILSYFFYIAASLVLAGMEWSRYFFSIQPNPWLYTLVSICITAFSILKVLPAIKQLRNMRQGLHGEMAVGQYLERCREQGAKVFHDIPGDNFNIDHVVIANSGVYVVETKSYSKPDSGEPTMYFDGKQVTLRERGSFKDPVIQAKAGATWIKNLLKESTGKDLTVRGVLTFPGWFVQPTAESKASDLWVLNPKAIPSFIENSRPKLSDDEVNMLAFHLSRYVRTK